MARTYEVPFDDELVEGGPLIFHAELGSPVGRPRRNVAPERSQGHTSTRRQAPKREQLLPNSLVRIRIHHHRAVATGEWVTCAIQLRISPEDALGL